MKEYREEAEKHRKAKLEKYGVDHKACGGLMKRAHGGKVEHSDEKEDKSLIKKEVKSECLKHRADGGPIAGSGGPRLGRGRKGGKNKGTNVNVVVAGKGDGPSAPPPALGAGPGPAIPSAPPPKPIIPAPAGPAGMPPRPGMPPMKRGGHVKKHHEHRRHHGHRGH